MSIDNPLHRSRQVAADPRPGGLQLSDGLLGEHVLELLGAENLRICVDAAVVGLRIIDLLDLPVDLGQQGIDLGLRRVVLLKKLVGLGNQRAQVSCVHGASAISLLGEDGLGVEDRVLEIHGLAEFRTLG